MFYAKEAILHFSAVNFRFIQTLVADRVFTIKLNRPEKRNAFTPLMVKEIAYALEYAQSNPYIWCVLIEAAGPVFCSGMDLNVFQNEELDEKNETLPAAQKEVNFGDAFKNLTKPSVCLVNGPVLGGGFLIIGGCTFVIATENSRFELPEVKRGIFPMQVMATLLKIIPPRKVLEMCILAKSYSCNEALELGLVTHFATAETLIQKKNDLIQSIIENSPFAIQKGIEAFYSLSDVVENERYAFLLEKLKLIKDSEDAREGLAAFKDKREPLWKNR
ncbi:enoyl-CoA hydratase/isomerase family protein [Rubrolithibacter danxiaensis]|uniref:enoyl-CoA hydratase/isomerase family protein n=1 Tax=Rubrolithibacter danxiaensis TaxID=3390805 RepID=UPI003BF7949F